MVYAEKSSRGESERGIRLTAIRRHPAACLLSFTGRKHAFYDTTPVFFPRGGFFPRKIAHDCLYLHPCKPQLSSQIAFTIHSGDLLCFAFHFCLAALRLCQDCTRSAHHRTEATPGAIRRKGRALS